MSNPFLRKTNYREQSKAFIIATEGNITEIEYFEKFKRKRGISIRIVPKETNSSPKDVLKKLKQYIKNHNLDHGDEAWIVIDRDDWPTEQITSVVNELGNIRSHGKCFMAMTNPKFEFWLLLHFEDGNGVCTSTECDRKLSNYLPNYNKHLDRWKLDFGCVRKAIQRAKRLDIAECEWPQTRGSTVYRLVEKLLPTE